MIKRRTIVFAVVLAGLVLFGGLALAQDFVWSGWAGEEESSRPMVEEMLNTWNAANPQAQFEWVGWPWVRTLEQLIIRSQGRETLDLAQADMAWLATLVEADILLDLNTILDEDWIKGNIQESYLEVGRVDGRQLALPWTLASIGMVYNPSLLEKAGLAKVPTTIEEFEAALAALQQLDSSIVPYALTTKDASAVVADFHAWLWTFGGRVFDDEGNITINDEAGVATLTWLKSLLDKGYIRMDMSRFDARELYAQNHVGFYDDAIMANSIFQTNSGKDEIDAYISPMLRPVLKLGDEPQSNMWGHILIVPKTARNPEISAEFLKHIISEELSVDYFVNTGMLPVINSALQREEITSNLWAEKWAEITQYGRRGDIHDYPQSAELQSIITEELQCALMGSKTPQKALDDAARRMGLALR